MVIASINQVVKVALTEYAILCAGSAKSILYRKWNFRMQLYSLDQCAELGGVVVRWKDKLMEGKFGLRSLMPKWVFSI